MAERRWLAIEAWPAIDQRRWAAARSGGDPLDDDGAAAAWTAKATRTKVMAYGLWLDYLTRTGQLEPDVSPARRVSDIPIRGFVEELQSRVSPVTLANYVRWLATMVGVLDPDTDRSLVMRVAARLDAAIPRLDRKAARVVDSRVVYEKAMRYLERLEGGDDAPSAHILASWRRDALMLAMLAARPLRLSNFAALRIGIELVRQDAIHQLRIDAADTKTRHAIEIDLPQSLTGAIDRYIARDRAMLLGNGITDRFWISVRRRPMSEQAIYSRIVATSSELLGQPLHPHLLRHCAATSLATHSPDEVRSAARLLGHRSVGPTNRYYNHARMLVSQRELAGVLREVRDALREEGFSDD